MDIFWSYTMCHTVIAHQGLNSDFLPCVLGPLSLGSLESQDISPT